MRLRHRLSASWKALTATPEALTSLKQFGGRYFQYPRSKYVDGAFIESQNASYATIYNTQVNVRIVVDKLAMMSAKRTLKCYEVVPGSDDRQEDPDFEAMETMREPSDWRTQSSLLEAIIKDKLIFNDAFLWDLGPDIDGKRILLRVPPYAMGVKTNNSIVPISYEIRFQDGTSLPLELDEVIHWSGYNPDSNRIGVSYLETLRTQVMETSVRQAQSIDMLRSGMVKGGIVTRGLEAPEWNDKARERFQQSFASRLKGTVHGEVALLEDAMQFQEAGITPREAEMLATRMWELAVVANLYGVNPALFTDQGNLAQAREMVEEDIIDPLLSDFADTLTQQLIRVIYMDETHYFKFSPPKITDIGKLFEAASKATGGSVMTGNEFRKKYLDLPPLPGGDELTVNPGAQRGGLPAAPDSEPRGRQPSEPEDLGAEDGEKFIVEALTKAQRERRLEQERQGKSLTRLGRAKSRRDEYAAAHAALFRRHLQRQLADQGRGGRGGPVNSERWNEELAADLYDLARDIVEKEGSMEMARFMGSNFDVALTVNYLREGARLVAANFNDGTADLIAEFSASGKADAFQKPRGPKLRDESPVESALTESAGARVEAVSTGRAQQLAAFSSMEAAQQRGGSYTKTWIASGLPNSRHGGMNGETVPAFEEFSNGLQYPGDPGGDVDEVANCQCSLSVEGGPTPQMLAEEAGEGLDPDLNLQESMDSSILGSSSWRSFEDQELMEARYEEFKSISKLSQEQIAKYADDVNHYAGTVTYGHVQDAFLGLSTSERAEQAAAAIRNLFLETPMTDRDLVMWRGLSVPGEVLKPGSVIEHGGLTSLSAGHDLAQIRAQISSVRAGTDDERVILRVMVPKGTRVINVDGNFSRSTDEFDLGERELILSPGAKLKVTGRLGEIDGIPVYGVRLENG